MSTQLRAFIRERAEDRCEYCLIPQLCTVLPHELEHIVAQKHGGPSSHENLAWACTRCNAYKQTDIAGIVPGTNTIVRLFNPRSDRWTDHFFWQDATIVGTTEIGIVTVYVLNMNHPNRVTQRKIRMLADQYF
jgi:hypothetical protein